MKRFAFKMYLKPGCEKEYEKRHAAIWPELTFCLAIRSVRAKAIHKTRRT